MLPKILLIEETTGAVKNIKRTLQTMGYSVFVETDAILGIVHAVDIQPNVIVLDRESANDASAAIVERIRLTPALGKTPVIFLGQAGYEESRAKILRFEHIHFLEKPCSEPQVISEIKKIFRQDRQQAKVVVVDDDPMLVKMLQSRIQANGFEVSAFTNSEEAIHRLQAEDPDLLVTDIIMPNVSGWMITQEIKRNEDFKNLPVILLSSLIEKEGQAERHEIGDYFMSKPVMMDKLVEKIKELILSQRKG